MQLVLIRAGAEFISFPSVQDQMHINVKFNGQEAFPYAFLNELPELS